MFGDIVKLIQLGYKAGLIQVRPEKTGGISLYSTDTIRSAARRVSQGETDVRRSERQLESQIQEGVSWWKGKAGSAFHENYMNKTKYEINRLCAEIRELEAGLESLAREAQTAEDQRRAEAAKKALTSSTAAKRKT
jgi:WXG100 family type VII secretion target